MIAKLRIENVTCVFPVLLCLKGARARAEFCPSCELRIQPVHKRHQGAVRVIESILQNLADCHGFEFLVRAGLCGVHTKLVAVPINRDLVP